MNFMLSDEQEIRVSATQAAVRERIAPVLAAHPLGSPLPKAAMLQVYAALAELGVTAPSLPAEAGGGGLGKLDFGLVVEQLPPVVALSLLSHESTLVGIHESCPAGLRERYLPELIAGRKIACTAHSESDAGSDASAIRTCVAVVGDEARLDGHKTWVTNAAIADLVQVSCAGDAEGRTRWALVDGEQSSFERRATPSSGLQQGHLGEIEFRQTRIPASHVSEVSGDAAQALTLSWRASRPLIGLMCVNLAQQAFEMALDYTRERQQFGKPLSGHQLVQQDLADIETAIVTSRLLSYHALDGLDRGLRSISSTAMAKRYATQACERAIHLAMQLHGAKGATEELGIERLWRDARMLQAPAGMNGILALIQGRELTGIGAFR